MTLVYYIVHSTSEDNEKGLVAGHYDSPLSALGKKQARELYLSLRTNKINFGKIYSSPLKRAYDTARILFPYEEITLDNRLREIDYGNYTHFSKSEIDNTRHNYIQIPFPQGESYEDVKISMIKFLREVFELPAITIVSHQAPQLALECLTKFISFQEAFAQDWRRKQNAWQPFWIYKIENDKDII